MKRSPRGNLGATATKVERVEDPGERQRDLLGVPASRQPCRDRLPPVDLHPETFETKRARAFQVIGIPETVSCFLFAARGAQPRSHRPRALCRPPRPSVVQPELLSHTGTLRRGCDRLGHMPATKATGVDKEVDELFQLPLGEFTAARNALAARLKKEGQEEEAARVKALPKPSVSAWAVNQLYWRHPKDFEALLESGERFRKAQVSQLAGKAADMRGSLDAHRDALTALTKCATEVLSEAGHPASPDMMRRITTTLEAVATYGRLPEAPPAGRLTDDVDPPGFDVLAALAPPAGRLGGTAPTRVLPFRQKSARQARTKKDEEAEHQARLAEARTAVAEAEKTLREARQEAEQAEPALKRAAARAKKAQQDKEREEKRFEKITAAADVATKEAHQVARQAEEAAQTVTDAERQLERAREQLQALD